MKKLKGLAKLTRFELPFSAGVCVVMGQLLAAGEFASPGLAVSAFLSIFFVSASILVLNDYFDVETDRINAPHRPIPAGLVTPNEAFYFSIFLLLSGFVLSFLISVTALISCVVLTIVGFLYNRKFKKSGLPGNLMVSFSVGMTFVFGGISVGLPFSKAALFFGIIAAFVDLGEEIAADSMDMEGDRLIDSNSIAIKYGRQTALKISGFIFITVILLTVIPFISGWFEPVYLISIAVMDISIGYSAYRLWKSKNDDGRRYIRRIYLGATLGLVMFILIRIILV